MRMREAPWSGVRDIEVGMGLASFGVLVSFERPNVVIPAKAGIHYRNPWKKKVSRKWIPTLAGMTMPRRVPPSK